MSTEGTYYVPEQSKLPLIAATGMGVMAYGAASVGFRGWHSHYLLDWLLDYGRAFCTSGGASSLTKICAVSPAHQLKHSYVSGYAVVYLLRSDVLCLLLWRPLLCSRTREFLDWWRSRRRLV